MARWRRAIELAMTDEKIGSLRALSRSRTEPMRRVERARMLPVCRETLSFYRVGRSLGTHHQTVERCVERALAYGALARAFRAHGASPDPESPIQHRSESPV
jgi:IS30 family transposase